MTFGEHFDELRSRILYCLLSVIVLFVAALFVKELIVEIILRPYEAIRASEGHEHLKKLGYIGPTENFLFYIKACFFAAIFVSTPFILYQMWQLQLL